MYSPISEHIICVGVFHLSPQLFSWLVSCMCSVGCQQHALTFPLGNHVLVSITHHRALPHGMTTIRVTEPQKATILDTIQPHMSYHHRNAHGDLGAQNTLIRRAGRIGDDNIRSTCYMAHAQHLVGRSISSNTRRCSVPVSVSV